jgi:hypothetical protein
MKSDLATAAEADEEVEDTVSVSSALIGRSPALGLVVIEP